MLRATTATVVCWLVLASCVVALRDFNGTRVDERPQFITVTLDDAIHVSMAERAKRVFKDMPLTFYVNVVAQGGSWAYDPALVTIPCVKDDGSPTGRSECLTNPIYVREMYNAGHEIALHTYSHAGIVGGERSPLSQQQIITEILANVDFLVKTGVPAKEIKGFRAPFLCTDTTTRDGAIPRNEALRSLQIAFNEIDLLYDSTFSATPAQSFATQGTRHCTTVEDGWNHAYCNLANRSQYPWPESKGGYPSFTQESYPGTWQVFMDTKEYEGQQLQLMDSVFSYCLAHGCDTNTVYKIYSTTFDRTYKASRAPYGIYLHGQSLDAAVEVDGLNKFLEMASKMQDVYLVTARQVAEFEATHPPREQWDVLYGPRRSRR